MSNTSASESSAKRPLSFLVSLWWGYALAAMYILYGGVTIILSFLDRNYGNLATPVIFVALGLLVVIFAYAFRDRKSFGWYGLIGINCIVALYSIFTLKQYGSLVILILCAVALAATFATTTRACFPRTR